MMINLTSSMEEILPKFSSVLTISKGNSRKYEKQLN
jgi:hypothetical protein